ncbi:hypothetical protein QQY66_01680 [Streptomyces sp. DG2A-72]|uniref:hypothetical protein n=1 Tax=Streptomyces sp. DG2A-72 TaxID=3051386 RepID=UPI00265C4055|nr:hypothetical protein [Streptomyces sp. DG2A-72]MDO0930471.1 hypothetical protein [Streptomyces sp. DG2A-72]
MGMPFEMDAVAGGAPGEGEAQDEDLLPAEAVGDHTDVPQALIELVADGLRVTAVGVDELVGERGFGVLLKVLGPMEAALDVAWSPLAS